MCELWEAMILQDSNQLTLGGARDRDAVGAGATIAPHFLKLLRTAAFLRRIAQDLQ